MGYYSQVAICLRTEDFKDMVNKAIVEYKAQSCPEDKQKFWHICRLVVDGFYKVDREYKLDEDMIQALNNVINDINKTSEFTVLEWDWVKWYHDFYDVKWIRDHMGTYDYYEEVEIGEDGAYDENRSEEGCHYCNIEAIHTIEIRV